MNEEPLGQHRILRDEHLRDVIREGILFPRYPLHGCGDAVPKATPKELPHQLVDDATSNTVTS